MDIKCKNCGANIPASEFAGAIGRAGTGSAKVRTAQQCRDAQRASVIARRRNKHIRIGREIEQAKADESLRRAKRSARRAKSETVIKRKH